MPDMNFDQIIADSIKAVKKPLGSAFKSAKPFIEHATQQFAEDAKFLVELRIANKIDDNELRERLKMQALAAKNVFLAIEGVGLIAAQNAINAIIGIVTEAIKNALNITLPI